MADSDVWRTASWGNVPWACASSIPKFWVVRTMVMAMGVVCVGDDGCRHGGRKIEYNNKQSEVRIRKIR